MDPYLLILLIGLSYIIGFSALSIVRRQGTSTRFIVEGLIITIVFTAISYATPISYIIFLIIIYLVTMRVRLLIDLGNWLTARKKFSLSLNAYSLALRLWPDLISRQIALINRGVTQLRMGEPEEAYHTLEGALADKQAHTGAKYLSAGYYNLGLACRRTNREAKAVRHFNEAISIWPGCIYAHAAELELEKRQSLDKSTGR